MANIREDLETARICEVCGSITHEGYQLYGKAYCSDECRNEYYREQYHLEGEGWEQEAERRYYIDYHGLDDDCDMTLEELKALEGAPEGNECFWTDWY